MSEEYRELTHPETARQMATLTPKGYKGLVAWSVRSNFYRLDADLSYLDDPNCDPLKSLIEEATMRSGSVGGGQRADVRDAIKGTPHTQAGFSITPMPGTQAEGAAAPKKEKRFMGLF